MKEVKMKRAESSQDQTGSSTRTEAVQATDTFMMRVMKPEDMLEDEILREKDSFHEAYLT